MHVQQDPSQAEKRKRVQDPSFDDLLEAVGGGHSLAPHSTVFFEDALRRERRLTCYNKAREGHSPGQWPNQAGKQQRPKRYEASKTYL